MATVESLRKSLTVETLASYFDLAFFKPYATYSDYKDLCKEAETYQLKLVCINSGMVKLCKKILEGSKVHVGGTVGFPLGTVSKEIKLAETLDAIENGADEIDYVSNMTELKEKNYTYIEQEMAGIVKACREHNITSKVIFENCFLTDLEKKELCRIAVEIRPDFIKTSTGYGSGGALESDIRLMKETVGDKVKIKASGGIRDLDTTLAMIAAGAERIGTSGTEKIMKEFLNVCEPKIQTLMGFEY